MTTKEQTLRVFTGTELLVNLLKKELEQVGVSAIVQNDFEAGLTAGFAGGSPSGIDLFVMNSEIDKAGPIIKDFIKRNELE